jgi:hypothetical protein
VISDNVPQASLLADALDEPDTEAFVNLLDALDPCERSFYEAEDNVVDINDKSDILFQEIQTHYGFVGGNRDEYRKYKGKTYLRAIGSTSGGMKLKLFLGLARWKRRTRFTNANSS